MKVIAVIVPGKYVSVSKLERLYNYTHKEPVKPIRAPIVVQALRCPNCGYEWIPRSNNIPKACPSCSIRFLNDVVEKDTPELSKEMREKLKLADEIIDKAVEEEEKIVRKIVDKIKSVYDEFGEDSRISKRVHEFLWDILKEAGYGISEEVDPERSEKRYYVVKKLPDREIKILLKSVYSPESKRKITGYSVDDFMRRQISLPRYKRVI